jgi:hypothetical protein
LTTALCGAFGRASCRPCSLPWCNRLPLPSGFAAIAHLIVVSSTRQGWMHGGGVLSPWAPPSPPRRVVLDPSGAAGGLHRVRLPLALLGIIQRVPSSDQARASHPGSRSEKG